MMLPIPCHAVPCRRRPWAAAACLVLALGGFAVPAQADAALDARIEAARQRLDAAARELAALHAQAAPSTHGTVFHARPNRGLLGVVPAAVAGRGVRVVSVLPEGGAAAAGLRAGDVLLRVRGRTLAVANPVAELNAAMAGSRPDERVAVHYQRGTEVADVQVTVGPAPHVLALPALPVGPGPHRGVGNILVGAPGGLQLSAMNPGLARYFGTDTGVLVLAGAGSEGDGLQDGDVVLKVAGQPARTVVDVLLPLTNPAGGAPVEVEVMRERATLTLHVTPKPLPRVHLRHTAP